MNPEPHESDSPLQIGLFWIATAIVVGCTVWYLSCSSC